MCGVTNRPESSRAAIDSDLVRLCIDTPLSVTYYFFIPHTTRFVVVTNIAEGLTLQHLGASGSIRLDWTRFGQCVHRLAPWTPRSDSSLQYVKYLGLLVSFTKHKVAVCKPYLSPCWSPLLIDPFRPLIPCGILGDWSLPLPFAQCLVICPILCIVDRTVSSHRRLVQWSWNIWAESKLLRFKALLCWQFIVTDSRYRRFAKCEQVCEWVHNSAKKFTVDIWEQSAISLRHNGAVF